MGLFRRKRAEPIENRADDGFVTGEEALITALIGSVSMTKEKTMQIPTVASCIERISETVASLPLKLYKRVGKDEIEEITNDRRLFLLNNDTKDTLTSNQFWKAIIQDYFLGKGGYAYINKNGTQYESIHYIDEKYVSITESVDPIFKTNQILINGEEHRPFELLKILRNTKNGIKGESIIAQNSLALSVGYFSFVFEDSTLKKGGNRKGFLTSENKLDDDAMTALKEAFRNLYSNNSEEKVVILNKGLAFQESSNTAVEMQLNENKQSNTTQLSMIFKISPAVLTGKATTQEEILTIKHAVMPVITEIESSLDRDMLTEKEKEEGYYWAFDTKELTRGSIEERYKAYEIALKNNFLQIDEVRKLEDMKELGFEWITLGLQNVLLNPETMEVYTPNTGQWSALNKGSLKGGGEE